jgi:two-component system response regulator FixJ
MNQPIRRAARTLMGPEPSKEIGIRLRISPKTVDNHRSWVMERMGARNLADLIRMAMKIQVHNERLT